MKQLENNDWMVINNIIYQINSIEDFTIMRRTFLLQMNLILDFDSADFYIASEMNSHNLSDPVYYNYNSNENEDYMEKYDGIDYSRGLMFGGKSKVYKETDIISEKKRIETEYYKKFFQPNNWHYALNMILAYKNQFVGVVSFFRGKEKNDFDYRDSFILDIIKEHLALKLYMELNNQSKSNDKLTVVECTEKYELTKREEMVLRNLIEGYDNNQISEKLCITNNTLKKHILNIYKKLQIKNRVQLFKIVSENG